MECSGDINLFFIEFLFEIIREKDEPVVAVIELVKAALKISEYH